MSTRPPFQFRLRHLFLLTLAAAVCALVVRPFLPLAGQGHWFFAWSLGAAMLLCPLTWMFAPRQATIGAVSAILGAIPAAAICALVFRFPVPFAGYESGIRAVPRVLIAAFFYDVLGGWLVLSLSGSAVGAIAGFVALRGISRPVDDLRRIADRLALGFGLLAALGAVLLLAVLDKIIGPW